MNNDNITNILATKIEQEIKKPHFAMSKEYKKQKLVPKRSNDIIVISALTQNSNIANAFVPIENKSFYLNYSFDVKNEPELIAVGDIPGIHLSYEVSSNQLSVAELCSMTHLIPDTFDKSVATPDSNTSTYHSIAFHDLNPDSYHIKIDRFINRLYSDHKSIKKLSKITKSKIIWIDVCFNGKYPLTSLDLEHKIIKKIATMNLTVVWDIYAE